MKFKIRFLIILLMLFLGGLPSLATAQSDQADGGIPSPKFVKVSIDGEELSDNLVRINDTVKIEYEADRLTVDGLILLGEGSNLTRYEPNNSSYSEEQLAQAYNTSSFSLDNAKGPKKFFSIEINITGFTKFYAWAWSGNFTNGTREEISSFDNEVMGGGFHFLWIRGEERYPTFTEVLNASKIGSSQNYQVKPDTTVSIRYSVLDQKNSTANPKVFISFADNQTNVFNSSRSNVFQMTWLGYDEGTKRHTFEYNMTLEGRLIFFSAYNDKGWERSSPSVEKVHKLVKGFSFKGDYEDFAENEFSDIDVIKTNITSINQTDNDRFFMRYRYGNESTELKDLNWTTVELNNITAPTIKNATVSNNTETVYFFSLNMTLNISDKIELQAFVQYFNYTEYRKSKIFTIIDSRPTVSFFGDNYTITNARELVVKYKVSTEKGELQEAKLTSRLNGSAITETFNIKNKENLNVEANTTLTFNLEGLYIVTINATNTLNRSFVEQIQIFIDFTAPTGAVTLDTTNSDSTTGMIYLDLSYDDGNGSGIAYILLDWGNGLVENVTGMTTVSFQYTRSGSYTISLTVFDKAGNNETFTETVTIELPKTQDVETTRTPFLTLPMILSLSVIAITVKVRRKK